MKVYFNNKGSIFISQNLIVKINKNINKNISFYRTVHQRRYHQDRIHSENNKSDIMTKNFAKDKHELKCEDVVTKVNQEQG